MTGVLALAALFALGSGQSFAAHVSCGDTITQDTKLDSDVTGCPVVGLVLGTNDITLDLNGHTVSADIAAVSTPPPSGGVSGVRIENGVAISRPDSCALFLQRTETSVVRSVEGGPVCLLNSNDNLIEKNSISLVTLHFSNDNVIHNNGVFGALVSGIALFRSDNNVVSNNIASHGRAGIDLVSSSRNLVEKNSAVDNSEEGILVGDGGFVPSEGNAVVKNHTIRNGDDGIDVNSSGTFLAGNHSRYNSDLGIEAVPDVLDGGGNKAFGNGNSLQCLNVVCK